VLLLSVAAISAPAPEKRPAEAPEPPRPPSVMNPIDNAELIEIPAGEFPMGSEEYDEDEKPVHKVKLRAFRLSRTEVTNEKYGEFLAATGHREPLYWKEERFNQPKQPVVGVDWHDALAYCRWANGRLPTEAEWEYAARGPEGRLYPWGKDRPGAEHVVMEDLVSVGKAAEVGTRPKGASPFGALDMAGNVWEWCADWYEWDYYTRSPAENPSGPDQGRQRVLRGGSWGLPSDVRSALRVPELPTFRAPYVGFRYAQDLTAPALPFPEPVKQPE